MKKIFLIISLIFFNFNNVIAMEGVFYCVDERVTGYMSSDIDKPFEKPVIFKGEKFKVNFITNNKIKMIEDGYDSELISKNGFFFTNNFDETVVFQPIKWEKNENTRHYVRSHTLPGDSLYVAQGTCDKF
jgi:hypothetical protein